MAEGRAAFFLLETPGTLSYSKRHLGG